MSSVTSVDYGVNNGLFMNMYKWNVQGIGNYLRAFEFTFTNPASITLNLQGVSYFPDSPEGLNFAYPFLSRSAYNVDVVNNFRFYTSSGTQVGSISPGGSFLSGMNGSNSVLGVGTNSPVSNSSLSVVNVIADASGYFGLRARTIAGTEILCTTGDGYTGVGTSSPTQKLHVSGNARLTGAFYDGTNSAGSSGNILSSTGSATQWVTAASIVSAANGLTTSTTFGGDVSGTYNNLQIGADAVGTVEIAANAITGSELASSGVTAGTYGGATSSAVITVDQDGRITSANNTTITDNDTNIGNSNLTVSGTRTLNLNNNTVDFQTGTGSFIVSTSSTSAIAQRWNIGQGAKVSMYDAAGSTLINQAYYSAGAYYTESPNRAPWQKGLTTSGLIAADYISKDATFYVHKDGYVVFPDVTTLSGTGSNKYAWSATNSRYEYLLSGTKKTVANVEDDFTGAAFSIRTSNFTLGGTTYSEIIDCNAGAVTVTLDGTMREGFDYVIKCRRNATNAVTFSAGGGYTLEIDESSSLTPTSLVVGAGGTGISANYKVYHLRRSGTNIFIN
jgi:hypothetical protein